jgi:hypothetical protein
MRRVTRFLKHVQNRVFNSICQTRRVTRCLSKWNCANGRTLSTSRQICFERVDAHLFLAKLVASQDCGEEIGRLLKVYVEEMNESERLELLRWITGLFCHSPGGFSSVQGFCINKDHMQQTDFPVSAPVVSLCSCQIMKASTSWQASSGKHRLNSALGGPRICVQIL